MTLALLPVVLVLLGGYFYLTSSERLAGLAGRALEGLTGAQVRIESARFNADASIMLRGVRMRVPGIEGEQGRLFEAEEVLIKHRMRSLVRGSFEARQIIFVRGVLYRTEDAVTGESTFALLQQSRDEGGAPGAPLMLPEMLVRNGEVRFGRVDEGTYEGLGSARFEGRLTPRDGGEAYDFSLRQMVPDGEGRDVSGPVWTGDLDFSTSGFSAQVGSISFGEEQRMMLPLPLRRWWDRLEPDGAVSGVRFGFDPGSEGGFFAELRLEGVGLTLQFGEGGWRMEGVSGRIGVERERIDVSGLAGRVEGIGYTVDGWIDGFSADAALRVAVVTEPFEVGERMHEIPALPVGVKRLFDRFAPRGTFAVDALLERSRAGAALTYSGNVVVRDAQMRFHKFQYPLEQVSGRVRFDENLVEVVGLVGRGPSGATVEVHGKISPPNDDAAVAVTVEATDGPLDEHVYRALAPRHRAAAKLFLDPVSHERLVGMGLIQTEGDRGWVLEELVALRASREAGVGNAVLEDKIAAAERQLARPVFELGGRLNLTADIVRPYGSGRKYETTIRLNLAGSRLLYSYWPYPVVVEEGSLLIRPGEVVVEGVVAHGLTGGVLTAEGTVRLGGGEGEDAGILPDLKVKAVGVSCDSYLLGSIPSVRRGLVDRLGALGKLDGEASIEGGEGGGVDFEVRLGMRDGLLRPAGVDAVLGGVEAEVALGRGGFELVSLSGDLRGARVSGEGWGKWDAGGVRYELELGAEGLQIDDRLGGLVPDDHPGAERLGAVVERYKPVGVIDAKVTMTGGAGDGVVHEGGYRVEVSPRELSFDVKGARVDLSDMSGKAVITSGLMALDGCGGSFGVGVARAWGDVPLDGKGRTAIRFDASADTVGPTARLMLPEAVLGAIDGLELDGRYSTVGGRLWMDRDEGSKSGAFGLRCRLKVEDGRAVIGVPITGLDGEFEIEASRASGAAWPLMDFRLHATRLFAADRLIGPLSVRLGTGEQMNELLISDLRGSCYGGVLIGSGRVLLAEGGTYKMGLTLEGVALDPFVHPAKYAAADAEAKERGSADVGDRGGDGDGADGVEVDISSPTGVLAANLMIEGSPTDITKRRGRGELDIQRASLYEVPLAMALMQVVNLSLPASKAFDRASAKYLIDGDWVLFDSLSFEAPTVQMKGSGTMRYSTLGLDLQMITRNPSGPMLGAVSDLFSVFKDELVSIRVGGTLDDPKPTVSSFTGIRRTWDDLFGPGRERDYVPLTGSRGEASNSGQ